MSKQWHEDEGLVNSVSSHLLSVMSMFPKRLLHVDELIHRFSMPLSQILILAMLEEKTLSIGQLSLRAGIAKPNITPLVDALISRGYVHLVRSASDRRVVQVEILPPGKLCLDGIRQAIAGQLRSWPDDLSREQVEHFDRNLDELQRFMSRDDA